MLNKTLVYKNKEYIDSHLNDLTPNHILNKRKDDR